MGAFLKTQVFPPEKLLPGSRRVAAASGRRFPAIPVGITPQGAEPLSPLSHFPPRNLSLSLFTPETETLTHRRFSVAVDCRHLSPFWSSRKLPRASPDFLRSARKLGSFISPELNLSPPRPAEHRSSSIRRHRAAPHVAVRTTVDRKSTRLNSSHRSLSRMPSSA